jgi:hypothetical protein
MEAGGKHGHVVAVEARGATLDEALENAWKRAKEELPHARTLEVLRILVHGENPISGYSVILAPPGH